MPAQNPRKALPAASEDLPRMSLLDHLEELRKRIVRALITLVIAFGPCWYFVDEIFDFLAQPIQKLLPAGTKLAFLGVTDPFILYFKVAGLAAVFLSSPFLLYQVWRFISPGQTAPMQCPIARKRACSSRSAFPPSSAGPAPSNRPTSPMNTSTFRKCRNARCL